MIKIRIKNADHEIDVRFPISENELYAKLAEIHAIEEKDAPQSAFVTEVYWPEEFSMLKDRFANLDELNYLAKRMESFDYLQIGDEAYVEHKLKNTLEQHDTLDSFDSELTNKTVKLIKLAENGSVSIILINDQEIRKEQTDHANSNPSDAT